MSGPDEQAAAERLKRLRCARVELEEARYNGVRRVRDANGEEVEYRSDAELARAMVALDQEIATMAGRTRNAFTFRTSKGLDHA
ncbi:phage head-tail joining protein [Methylopila henanensis]|uniref:Phage head-tail joining protein n=1 Tax=Methylopila henanensis TaxID=873516 RepID=A0ABW4K8D6_9HYPH